MYPFIALEGCDGTGKTTVRELLAKELRDRGAPCSTIGQHSWLDLWSARAIVRTREGLASYHRDVVRDAYCIDKREHSARNVRPQLKAGVVITDRWILSDAVYHQVLYGAPAEETIRRHRAAGTLRPSLLIYVEVAVDEAYRRILKRGKHTRHYERPTELRQVAAAYEQVLNVDACADGVIRFDNTAANVEERVREILLPAVLAILPSEVKSLQNTRRGFR